jgi:hypothetical protein
MHRFDELATKLSIVGGLAGAPIAKLVRLVKFLKMVNMVKVKMAVDFATIVLSAKGQAAAMGATTRED